MHLFSPFLAILPLVGCYFEQKTVNDENKISGISNGFFRINMPGLYFNNSNWPYIRKSLRIWDLVTLLTMPPLYLLSLVLPSGLGWNLFLQNAILILYLAGLFVPVYIVGRKYS